MTPQDNVMTLLLIVHIFALWGVWYFLIRETQREDFRQKMFALRDEMFVFVGENKLGYDNPAYTLSRVLFNGAIRFSDRLDIFTILVSRFMFRRQTNELSLIIDNRLSQSLKVLDPDTKKVFQEYHHRFRKEAAMTLLFTSISMMVLVAICAVFVLIYELDHVGLKLSIKTLKSVRYRIFTSTDPILRTVSACSYSTMK